MGCENAPEDGSRTFPLRTFYSVSVALTVILYAGVGQSQSSTMMSQLKANDSFIEIQKEEIDWIVRIQYAFAPISAAVLAGPLMDMFGRKMSLAFYFLVQALGFGILGYAQNVYHIYIGRAICGFGAGFEQCSVVYIAEVCDAIQRNMVFVAMSVVYSCGVSLISIFGAYLPWRTASLIFSVASLVIFVLNLFIPESPSWLFKTGRESDCIKNLQSLGKTPAQISRELEVLKLSKSSDGKRLKLRRFLKPTVWKPFAILSTVFILKSAAGVYDVVFYTTYFIKRLGTIYDPAKVAAAITVAGLLQTVTIGIYLSWTLNRRATLAVSAFGMMVSFVVAGIYEYVYLGTEVLARPWNWLPATLLATHLSFSSIGVTSLPWQMTGELYPLKVRGIMTSVTYAVGNLVIYIFLERHRSWVTANPIHLGLFAFSFSAFVLVLFAIYVLPETMNVPLHEIEMGFLRKKERMQADPPSKLEQTLGEEKLINGAVKKIESLQKTV